MTSYRPWRGAFDRPLRPARCPKTLTALALSLGVAGTLLANAELPAIPIAVADFDYSDTSGESRDRTAEHKALIASFVRTLRDDLAKGKRYRIVTLDCQPGSCSADQTDPTELLKSADRAGAKFLLVGSVHKVSTLIQEASVAAVDVKANRVLFSRALSFRGDDERAWMHAEAFLARELEAQDFAK